MRRGILNHPQLRTPEDVDRAPPPLRRLFLQEVEEMAETLKRFGYLDEEQAEIALARAADKMPDVAEKLVAHKR